MAYDEKTFSRAHDEEPTDPLRPSAPTESRHPSGGLGSANGETVNYQQTGSAQASRRDRLGIHIGWEVVLLLTAGVFAVLLFQADDHAFGGATRNALLVTGAAIGLLTLGAGLTLRAGVPNLALGPIALAASFHYAEQGDHGVLQALLPAVIVAAAGGAVVGILILALHVPGWAATLGAAMGVLVYDQLRVTAVNVQGHYNPAKQAVVLFAGFVALALLGGVLGAVSPLRRWFGRMRPVGDPARRRGVAVVLPVLAALVLSSVFAVGAGTLLAAVNPAKPVQPGTGMEWTGIAIGLALLAGTSAYGRRGGIFGTVFAVAALTMFLGYAEHKKLGIATYAIAAALVAAGLVVTRLVEKFGRRLPVTSSDDWNNGSGGAGNWSPTLPDSWTADQGASRTDRWDEQSWGSSR